MAEFCKCGSLILGGRCSNKACSFKSHGSQVPVKPIGKGGPAGKAPAGKAPAKAAKTRRASKCITYNLYEPKNEEGGN